MAKEDSSYPVSLDHVADCYRRYPGEVVTFYSRVTYEAAAADMVLRVWVPVTWIIEDYASQLPNHIPRIEVEKENQCLAWTLVGKQPAGTTLEFQAKIRVNGHPDRPLDYRCLAELNNLEGHPLGREIVVLNVETTGRYLRLMPELYEQDEMMGRFLMLFESFWKPVDGQIANVQNYFDPKLTPPAFLPWLASWFGLDLDTQLPESRQRRLLSSAVTLYRRRGTRLALQEYLEIVTGGEVQIVEHRAHDLRLGAQTRLGPGIALGTGNQPHTFSVRVRLPPARAAADKEERTLEDKRQQMAIEAIIRAQKPAHTRYRLVIERAG